MQGRSIRWVLLVVCLGVGLYALAEDLTLTTYYPSPRGVYNELRTSGDVAIGTTAAPSARLQVVGSLSAPALYVVGQGGTTTLRVDDAPGGDSSAFLIDSSGNVGIGTTDPGGFKLRVEGGWLRVAGTGNSSGTDSAMRIGVYDTDNTGGITGWWVSQNQDGKLAIHQNGVGDRLTIDGGGNVGIGTTSPGAKLEVNGTLQVNGNLTDGAGQVIYDNSTKKIPEDRLPFKKGDLIAPADRPLISGLAAYPTSYFNLDALGINGTSASNVKTGVAFGPGNAIIGTDSGGTPATVWHEVPCMSNRTTPCPITADCPADKTIKIMGGGGGAGNPPTSTAAARGAMLGSLSSASSCQGQTSCTYSWGDPNTPPSNSIVTCVDILIVCN